MQHPMYNLKKESESDIALLKLEKPLNFTKEIIPICLPIRVPNPTTIAITTGWGRTNFSGINS
jgi:hypothetical protein